VNIAERAISVLRDPLGLPEIVLDADIDADVTVEQARLAVLAAHSAAIDPDCAWRTDNAQVLANIATRLIDPEAPTDLRAARDELALALRIEVADAIARLADPPANPVLRGPGLRYEDVVRRTEPLNARQVEVLRWIADGHPATDDGQGSFKRTAAALQDRRLVRISRRGGTWTATLTDGGRHYGSCQVN